MGNHVSKCYRTRCSCLCVLTPDQHRDALENGTPFHCSAGHSQVYRKGESRLEKTQRLLTEEQRSHGYTKSRLRDARKTWKCPFAGCGNSGHSQGAMVRHIRRHHMMRPPLMLPADAGPDAKNTEVHR